MTQLEPLWDGLIYNVTVQADASIAEAWLEWMQEEYIPDMLQTGCFTAYRILRLLDIDDSEGPTYAVQYHAESRADYNRYIELHASRLQKKSFDKWGDRFIAFRSLMEVIH